MLERILVIDDDALSRELLELLLTQEGYAVTVASSGDEALATMEGAEGAACPEVVLSDMQMPGVCGEALFRRLRERCGTALRVIAMSGNVPAGGVPEGAEAFLLKPFSMEAFGAVLRGGGWIGTMAAGADEEEDPEAGQTVVLDEAVFGSFRAMLGAETLVELYGACVRDAEAQGARMREAEAAGDDVGLRKFAHAMKGSLGMLGARELEGMCLTLETGVVNASYVRLLVQFPDAIQRLRDMLNALSTLR